MPRHQETEEAEMGELPKNEEDLKRLLQASLRDDGEGKQQFWEQARLTIYKFARIVCNRLRIQDADVDDVVQEAILRIYRLPTERLRKIKSWNEYLFTTVRNCAINVRGRRQRIDAREVLLNQTAPDCNESAESRYELLPGYDDVVSEVCARELTKAIDDLLATASKEKAAAFCLYCRGYMYREIADTLGIPENTVATYIYRIKREILKWLDQTEQEGHSDEDER